MNNVLTRSLSGIVYVALIVCATLSKSLFPILTLLFVVLGTHEYLNISQAKQGYKMPLSQRIIDIIAGVATWAVCCSDSFSYNNDIALIIVGLYFFIRFISAVLDKTEDSFSNIARSFLGWFYIAAPLAILNVVNFEFHELLLPMFVLIWINDTGAYCVGSTIGKRRLCERLSPKKSWEGFWGGLAFCVIAAIIYSLVKTDQAMIESVVIAVLVSVMSTIGDLFESMLKRSAGIKDSGNLIPGHGGILDRIDSLLFVAPTIFFIEMLIKVYGLF